MTPLMVRSCLIMVLALTAPARASPPSVDEMCKIIRQDIAAYLATGHPCPCPYSITHKSGACGNRAAWAKPDGRIPRCYFEDVDGTLPPNHRPTWPDLNNRDAIAALEFEAAIMPVR
jgi:hypothetical protein